MSESVEYQGDGTHVLLDFTAGTLTITHHRRSRHSGQYVVPLTEVMNVEHSEKQPLKPGWVRVRTATGTHPTDPAEDPYGWRTGRDHVKPFAYLVYFVARMMRGVQDANVTREVISEELDRAKGYLRRLKDQQ